MFLACRAVRRSCRRQSESPPRDRRYRLVLPSPRLPRQLCGLPPHTQLHSPLRGRPKANRSAVTWAAAILGVGLVVGLMILLADPIHSPAEDAASKSCPTQTSIGGTPANITVPDIVGQNAGGVEDRLKSLGLTSVELSSANRTTNRSGWHQTGRWSAPNRPLAAWSIAPSASWSTSRSDRSTQVLVTSVLRTFFAHSLTASDESLVGRRHGPYISFRHTARRFACSPAKPSILTSSTRLPSVWCGR